MGLFVAHKSGEHAHTSMPAGSTCKHCGHDSSHHVQFTGSADDQNSHPCWFGIARSDECASCPGFEPVLASRV